MKKNARRLRLHRETVLKLQSAELNRVAGAGTSMECFHDTGCNCASQGGTDCYPRTACFGTCSC
jgi:hypothetical protein